MAGFGVWLASVTKYTSSELILEASSALCYSFFHFCHILFLIFKSTIFCLLWQLLRKFLFKIFSYFFLTVLLIIRGC